jgi:hypothetical protein
VHDQSGGYDPAVPHVSELICQANRLLDGTDAGTRDAALSALDGASSVLQAVELAGLIDQLDKSRQPEARDALKALPGSVDAALLAVLKGALKRGLQVVIQWKPGPNTELQVWEAVDGNVGHVGVMLITPYARESAASS